MEGTPFSCKRGEQATYWEVQTPVGEGVGAYVPLVVLEYELCYPWL